MPTPRKTKSTKTKGRGIGDRNRARILDAAVGVFARKGFDGARIAEIAQRSGLPKANVYYYFRNKHAIYETVIASLIAEWDHALSHLDAARDPADTLASYIQAKLDFPAIGPPSRKCSQMRSSTADGSCHAPSCAI